LISGNNVLPSIERNRMRSDVPQIVNATSSVVPLLLPETLFRSQTAEATKVLFYRTIGKA
jgi:hypothetical protein